MMSVVVRPTYGSHARRHKQTQSHEREAACVSQRVRNIDMFWAKQDEEQRQHLFSSSSNSMDGNSISPSSFSQTHHSPKRCTTGTRQRDIEVDENKENHFDRETIVSSTPLTNHRISPSSDSDGIFRSLKPTSERDDVKSASNVAKVKSSKTRNNKKSKKIAVAKLVHKTVDRHGKEQKLSSYDFSDLNEYSLEVRHPSPRPTITLPPPVLDAPSPDPTQASGLPWTPLVDSTTTHVSAVDNNMSDMGGLYHNRTRSFTQSRLADISTNATPSLNLSSDHKPCTPRSTSVVSRNQSVVDETNYDADVNYDSDSLFSDSTVSSSFSAKVHGVRSRFAYSTSDSSFQRSNPTTRADVCHDKSSTVQSDIQLLQKNFRRMQFLSEADDRLPDENCEQNVSVDVMTDESDDDDVNDDSIGRDNHEAEYSLIVSGNLHLSDIDECSDVEDIATDGLRGGRVVDPSVIMDGHISGCISGQDATHNSSYIHRETCSNDNNVGKRSDRAELEVLNGDTDSQGSCEEVCGCSEQFSSSQGGGTAEEGAEPVENAGQEGSEISGRHRLNSRVHSPWKDSRSPKFGKRIKGLGLDERELSLKGNTVRTRVNVESSASHTLNGSFNTQMIPASPVNNLLKTPDRAADTNGTPQVSFLASLTPKRHATSARHTLLAHCHQEAPISFTKCMPCGMLGRCKKIGEGVYGEVYRTVNKHRHTVAVKIIPIEGNVRVNGEVQKRFGEIVPEVAISKELSNLCSNAYNKCHNFVQLHRVSCVRGSYPRCLVKEWDLYEMERGSDNDRPDIFDDDQLFVVFEFDFAGTSLEDFELDSVWQGVGILSQVCHALAVAECELQFEHRDLHWGNVLVKHTSAETVPYVVNGHEMRVATCGVEVTIIDFTLSRLHKDDCTTFSNLANDPEIFEGEGDLQFDIYRSMQQESGNEWEAFNPHTNIWWLYYLAHKICHKKTFASKKRADVAKLREMSRFVSVISEFGSTYELVTVETMLKGLQ